MKKQCDDGNEAKEHLHKLLKKVAFSTNYGEEEKDYTKTINLNIGGGMISYDPYYQKLWFYGHDDSEFEIDDSKTIKRLVKDIEKRYKEFEMKINITRQKIVKEIFDKPINQIIDE
ncbi:hypothetical protein HYY70_04260 [Candidatus Woesearchaeota archaeon]|nr:hypothetical protein [Candidatus Woesearchaeota archaeon]